MFEGSQGPPTGVRTARSLRSLTPQHNRYEHAGKSQFLDFEVIWNYQYPSTGRCQNDDGTNCTYAFTWEHTPVAYHEYEKALAGEEVTLDLIGWKVTESWNNTNTTRNFPWFCSDEVEENFYSYSYEGEWSYSYGDDPYGCDDSIANLVSQTSVYIVHAETGER